MDVIRAVIRRNPAAFALLMGAALLLKVLVPAGMMVSGGNRGLSVTICADATAAQTARTVAIPMKQTSGEAHDPAKGACPYAALSMAGLGGTDPLLQALALAFVLVLGFAPRPALPLQTAVRSRPPLRGPPQAA